MRKLPVIAAGLLLGCLAPCRALAAESAVLL